MREILFSEPYLPPLEEYTALLQEIWNTKQIATFGPMHKRFEIELGRYLNTKQLFVFTNGHTALETAISTLKKRGEIITTPFTFISTANAIARNGFKPVFCDIDGTMTLDPEEVKKHISSETVAILAVHTLGNPCHIEELAAIGNEYGIPIIYDGAHVFGLRYKGMDIGCFGDLTMFSFHASKVFNSAEGGALSCNNEELGCIAKLYRYYGLKDGNVIIPGLNGKMHELTAALGLCNLKHINEIISYRQKLFNRYREVLKSVSGISFRSDSADVDYNYIYFYIFVDETNYGKTADQLCYLLNSEGIHAKKIFPRLINQMDAYSGYKHGKLSNSLFCLNHIIVLPLHTNMTEQDVDIVCQIIVQNSGG